MERAEGTWNNLQGVPPKKFRCGYCGTLVGPNLGYSTNTSNERLRGHVYICSYCNHPTYFNAARGAQIPGVPFGNPVERVPEEIDCLYQEARRCASESCYTASVLTCRKVLMNIAVNKGAKPNQSFVEYVQYLASKGYVPPGGEGWVDHIRKKGNEANHEIHLMEQSDAEDLITFSEMLLKFIYEFPGRIAPPPATGGAAAT